MPAGTVEFLNDMTDMVEKKLDISKLEDKVFRFTRFDVKSEKERLGWVWIMLVKVEEKITT